MDKEDEIVANYKQLGTTGLNRYGGYVYEEFMSTLRWPYAAKVYKEMADNDPVVGAILYLAEMLIRKTPWRVEAASDKSVDKDAATFVESCMHDMSASWANTITEVLSMFTYGFSFHEVVYKIRRGPLEKSPKYISKHTDGKIGWQCLPVRSQSTLLEWLFDDYSNTVAFIQQAPPNYRVVTIPMSKGLLFRTRISRGNPEGKSLLRNAYRPWYFKKRIEEIEGIGVERDLAGLPVLKAPEGLDLWDDADPRMATLRTTAETLIKNVRRDSEEGVLLPYGWDLSLLSTGSSRQFDTNAIINRYDNRIAITMLSDIVLIGGEKTGSFALADTKKSLLGAALEAQTTNIADTFNTQAIPQLINLNNFDGITDYPKLVAGEIETPDLKELALILRAMNLDISKDLELMNFVRQVASMPQLDKESFEKLYNSIQQEVKANDAVDDITNNVFEQSDMAYTSQ